MIDYARINNTIAKLGYHLETHNSICVSVSGGSDSDIIVHIIATYFRQHLHKIHFVFANTGLEYNATLRHLDYLEQKYNIKIDRVRGMPIPVCVKKYGVPFVSKQVSDYASRMQKHGFKWDNWPFEDLYSIYPRCKTALKWWCNDSGEKSRFNISRNKGLKKFILYHGIKTKISSMCCEKSKKAPVYKYHKAYNIDLQITGERKSEGGRRAAHTSCTGKSHGIDKYMPLFFWDNATKSYYEQKEQIKHSDCYTVYGLTRTGCVGCPLSRNRKKELEVMQKYEPNLYSACMYVFGESYSLTDQYDDFKDNI